MAGRSPGEEGRLRLLVILGGWDTSAHKEIEFHSMRCPMLACEELLSQSGSLMLTAGGKASSEQPTGQWSLCQPDWLEDWGVCR